MADQETKDAAAKQRIVTHMNNDHQDSLVRYVEHYHKVSSWSAQTAEITSIDLNGMTLSCGSKVYPVPFNPPLSSYRDVRERVVAMDKECLAGLKRSDITVKKFLPATGAQAVSLAVIVATLLSYSQRSWFAKGHVVESLLGSGFAKFSWTIQPYLFWGMILIHSGEALFIGLPRLSKHSVSLGSPLWVKWIVSWWVEGVGCMGRFDQHVKRQEEARAKQQH